MSNFLENGRSPGDRSLTVAAQIGAPTVREGFPEGYRNFHHSLETPLGFMSNLCHC
jgi:hypothetical protein